MTSRHLQALILASLLALMTGAVPLAAAERLVVFSAASAAAAIEEVADEFSRTSGIGVLVSPGASSIHARQIAAGARADLYISANPDWMDWANDKGLLEKKLRTTLMSNRLVLAANRRASLPGDLMTALTQAANTGRIAMGDPDHVPVGQYGKAALVRLGVWEKIRHRLARSPNAVAAVSLIARGEASAGIVYATDVRLSRAVRVVAEFPDGSYPAIRYQVAVISGRNRPATRRFLDALSSPAGQEILASHGFPGCPDIRPC